MALRATFYRMLKRHVSKRTRPASSSRSAACASLLNRFTCQRTIGQRPNDTRRPVINRPTKPHQKKGRHQKRQPQSPPDPHHLGLPAYAVNPKIQGSVNHRRQSVSGASVRRFLNTPPIHVNHFFQLPQHHNAAPKSPAKAINTSNNHPAILNDRLTIITNR